MSPAVNETGSAGIWDVRAYGARGDGQALDSGPTQEAINACSAAGGGVVLVPPGMYRAGPIELKSGVALHLARGALLQASDRVADYRVEGKRRGLITARGVTDIAIEGEGIIDGAAGAFHLPQRAHFKQDFARHNTRQGERFLADMAKIVHGPWDFDQRPGSVVLMHDCENVTVRDVTFRNAPEWTFRVARCRRLLFENLVIDNGMAIPNSDGIHVTGCQNVRIVSCDISAGDDAIAITTVAARSGMAEDCPEDRRVMENAVVTNCILRSRSSAVRIGYGPFETRRVVLSNLVIHGSNRGIGLFTRNGGAVRDVLCSNIVMDTDIPTGHWWGKGEPIHLSAVPGEGGEQGPGAIEHVRFSQVEARSPAGCVLYADEPGLIRDITLDQLGLRLRPSAQQDDYSGNLDLRPIRDRERTIFQRDIAAVDAENVRDLVLRDPSVSWEPGLADWYTHAVHGRGCQHVRIDHLRGRAQRDTLSPVRLENCADVAMRTIEQDKELLDSDASCTNCRVLIG